MFGIISDIVGKLSDNQFAEERQKDAQTFNAEMQYQSQNFNSAQAALQRDWAERMSNTTYQRGVADLKAAGLNPLLAVGSHGAPMPTGSHATAGSNSAGIASPGSGTNVQAAMQSASQIEVNDALAARTRAEEAKVHAETANIKEQTPTHAVTREHLQQQIAQSKEQVINLIQQTATSAASAGNLVQQTINLKALIPQIQATIDNLKAQTTLHGAHTKLTGAQTSKTAAEEQEIRQRVKENLPALEAALRNLEMQARGLDMPRREQERSVQDSFTGSLGAVLRALNPFTNFFNAR